MKVEQLSPSLGAEVHGLSLTDADTEEINQLLLEHKVLFFPGQHLAVEDHVAFGRHMAAIVGGDLEAHPNIKNAFLDHPEIFELAASRGGIADEWHTDLTFQEEPSILSILNMVECPPVGGDTMWTNLALAFEQLSPAMQEMCEGLTALHDAHAHNRAEQMAVHPVVRTHPVTGEKVLYVSEHFTRRIVELTHIESEALLSLLTGWVRTERFTVRYRWTKGTIAMWDNRCTQHHVLNDFVGERIIQRVTVTGDRPEGAVSLDKPRYEPRVEMKKATGRFDRQLSHFLRDRSAT